MQRARSHLLLLVQPGGLLLQHGQLLLGQRQLLTGALQRSRQLIVGHLKLDVLHVALLLLAVQLAALKLQLGCETERRLSRKRAVLRPSVKRSSPFSASGKDLPALSPSRKAGAPGQGCAPGGAQSPARQEEQKVNGMRSRSVVQDRGSHSPLAAAAPSRS